MVKHPVLKSGVVGPSPALHYFFFASLTWPIMKESGIRWVMPGGG